MRGLLKVAMIGLMSLAVTQSAMARGDRNSERFVLEFNHEHLRGQNTLKLKQKLKQEFDIEVRDLVIKKVKLIAKTRNGGGTATLKMGRDLSDAMRVAGTRQDFRMDQSFTYDKVVFRALGDGSLDRGVFQIKLNGNFKIDRVVIVAEKMGPRVINKAIVLNSQEFTGMNKIGIKAKLRQMGVSPRDYDLEGIWVFAKSPRGFSSIELKVGDEYSDLYDVAGNRRQYRRDGVGTYNEMYIANPSWDSEGAWKLLINGTMKIDAIIVQLIEKDSGRVVGGRRTFN